MRSKNSFKKSMFSNIVQQAKQLIYVLTCLNVQMLLVHSASQDPSDRKGKRLQTDPDEGSGRRSTIGSPRTLILFKAFNKLVE